MSTDRHPEPEIERAVLTGVLELASPLHLGSGFTDRPGGEGAEVATLCRDQGGAPYLPGSSLRGRLRRFGPAAAALREHLFGCARRAIPAGTPAGAADPGRAGALRVYDARLVSGAPAALPVETRVALDPVTRTALEHHLFSAERLPAGARFACRFELERSSEAELEALIDTLLGAFAPGTGEGLGAGRARLDGLLHWTPEGLSLQRLDRGPYLRWLTADADLDHCWRSARIPRREAQAAADLRLQFRLYPRAPLLVGVAGAKDRHGGPDRVFQAADGRVLVPASSLKGALRAQARRILLTMLTHRARDADPVHRRRVVADLTGEVFGSTAAMAGLFVGPASGAYTETDVHPQWFTALDRFTGGVADQRLYQVRAVLPPRLDCEWRLRPRSRVRPWVLGLLCYLVRDALEGDLWLGWGRARGYGAVRMVPAQADLPDPPPDAAPDAAPEECRTARLERALPDWSAVLATLAPMLAGSAPVAVDHWLADLDTELDRRLAALTAPAVPTPPEADPP